MENLEKTNQNSSIIEMLRNTLSYNEYMRLHERLNISRNRFTRCENSEEFDFDELYLLLKYLYAAYAESALIPAPDKFIALYEQTHITLDQLEKLNAMHESILNKPMEETI